MNYTAHAAPPSSQVKEEEHRAALAEVYRILRAAAKRQSGHATPPDPEVCDA